MFAYKIRWPLVWCLLQWWGVMVVAKKHSDKESRQNKERAQKQLQGSKYIKQEQSKRNNDYLSGKQNSKK
jgi:hypothetical protein